MTHTHIPVGDSGKVYCGLDAGAVRTTRTHRGKLCAACLAAIAGRRAGSSRFS